MTEETYDTETGVIEEERTGSFPMIFEGMANCVRDVGKVDKGGYNSHGNYNYRGVEDIMNAVNRAMAKNRIFCLPSIRDHKMTNAQTSTGKPTNHHLVTVDYTFHAIDGSKVTAQWMGESQDSSDKGLAQAESMSLKNLFAKTFMIPFADMQDPDSKKEDMTRTGPPAQQNRQQATQPPPPKQLPPADPAKKEWPWFTQLYDVMRDLNLKKEDLDFNITDIKKVAEKPEKVFDMLLTAARVHNDEQAAWEYFRVRLKAETKEQVVKIINDDRRPQCELPKAFLEFISDVPAPDSTLQQPYSNLTAPAATTPLTFNPMGCAIGLNVDRDVVEDAAIKFTGIAYEKDHVAGWEAIARIQVMNEILTAWAKKTKVLRSLNLYLQDGGYQGGTWGYAEQMESGKIDAQKMKDLIARAKSFKADDDEDDVPF